MAWAQSPGPYPHAVLSTSNSAAVHALMAFGFGADTNTTPLKPAPMSSPAPSQRLLGVRTPPWHLMSSRRTPAPGVLAVVSRSIHLLLRADCRSPALRAGAEPAAAGFLPGLERCARGSVFVLWTLVRQRKNSRNSCAVSYR